MHEASIALSVLKTVTDECERLGFTEIESIRLRIGTAAGILQDALTFAFDIVKKETIAQAAQLQIDLIPLGGLCDDCGATFEAEERFILECPQCHSANFKINQGYEMDIVDMEVN